MTVLRASVPDADEDLFFSFLLTRVVGVVAGRGDTCSLQVSQAVSLCSRIGQDAP
jgi:hypothetical protein